MFSIDSVRYRRSSNLLLVRFRGPGPSSGITFPWSFTSSLSGTARTVSHDTGRNPRAVPRQKIRFKSKVLLGAWGGQQPLNPGVRGTASAAVHSQEIEGNNLDLRAQEGQMRQYLIYRNTDFWVPEGSLAGFSVRHHLALEFSRPRTPPGWELPPPKTPACTWHPARVALDTMLHTE